LLEMETDLGKKWFAFFEIGPSEFKILICLCKPLMNDLNINHKGLCLPLGSLSEKDRPI
jgi:hypothetical protein